MKRLMGQNTGLESAYYHPDESQILEGNEKMIGYIGVMSELTINPTAAENAHLQKKLAETQSHHSEEWEKLRIMITELKQRYEKYGTAIKPKTKTTTDGIT